LASVGEVEPLHEVAVTVQVARDPGHVALPLDTRHGVVRSPIELASSPFLSDTAPLLEKERDVLGVTLIQE
jgi:hypothetical protein